MQRDRAAQAAHDKRRREQATTLGELVGGAAVAVGAGLVFVPAGVIVAGLLLVGFSFMAADR